MIALQQPNGRITPAESAALVAAYQAGATAQELSRQYGISPRAVRSHIHRAGIPLRSKTLLTRGQALELTDRYQRGETGADLASAFNCSERTVFLELRRAGLAVRPRGHRSK